MPKSEPASTVLLIDTHPHERMLTVAVLRSHFPGLQVREVGKVTEFVTAFGADGYGLIILDPDPAWGESAEQLKLLRDRFPATPVVLFTAGDTANACARALSAGARAYIHKDVGSWAEHLPNALHEILGPDAGKAATETPVPNGQLAESNRLLSNYAHLVAHEIRNPVEQVRRAARLIVLENRDKLQGDAQELLATLERTTEEVSTIVSELLLLSSLSGDRPGTFAPIDLSILMQGILGGMRDQIKEARADVRVGELPTVSGNEAQIRLLFRNLLENAIKFRRKESTPVVQVDAQRDGSRWSIAIIDNGIGIPPQSREKILEPFVRLHPRDRYPGTGLGLAICRRIAELHDTRLVLDANVPQGTVVKLSLAPG